MCGIAGYSRGPESLIEPEQAARVLLASVADRGADAAGCAWINGSRLQVDKQTGGASAFLDCLQLPDDVRNVLLHVRDHTKGRPSLDANNHPIRHGRIIGVHNGRIENDEQVFARLGRRRAEPGMTVDSEAIFAALDFSSTPEQALAMLRGSLATAWVDEHAPESVFLARGYGRPLWTALTPGEHDVVWASTLEALEIAEEFLGLRLHKRPMRPGTVLHIADGQIRDRRRFDADASASWLANPIASPDERSTCLARLEPRIA